MMGPITDWSLVRMSFWIQLSPNHIDLSVRFTSKYIKNAHSVFLSLSKGNQGTTGMPVPPLFSLCYISEIQAHRCGRFEIWPLLFLGCIWVHFFREMTSSNSLPSSSRQSFALPFLLMLYAAATPNITPANPPHREGVWETAVRYPSFRAQYSEYFVPYAQQQSASRADEAILTLCSSPLPGGKSRVQCLIQQLPSSVSDMWCKSWARDRRG